MGQKVRRAMGSQKIWAKLVITRKWGSTQAFFGSEFTPTVIFRATNNQTLKFLGNICAHLFSKFDCNYGHHLSKARCKGLTTACSPWGGGLLFWVLFILLLRSYFMGFSAAHRELTHCDNYERIKMLWGWQSLLCLFQANEEPLHQLLSSSTRYDQC